MWNKNLFHSLSKCITKVIPQGISGDVFYDRMTFYLILLTSRKNVIPNKGLNWASKKALTIDVKFVPHKQVNHVIFYIFTR